MELGDLSTTEHTPVIIEVTDVGGSCSQLISLENQVHNNSPQSEVVSNVNNTPKLNSSCFEQPCSSDRVGNVVNRSLFTSGTSIPVCTCCPQHNFEGYLKQIIRHQNLIQAGVRQILDDVERLHQSRLHHQEEDDNNDGDLAGVFDNINLPVGDMESLKILDQFLNNPENFKKALARMTKIRGDTPYQFIKGMLPRFIQDGLLKHYNWLGKKQKHTFQKLNIAQLLLRGLQKNPATAGCTEKEGECVIKKFLKGAKERGEKLN